MNDLSTINEIALESQPKQLNETNEKSEDSGLASSEVSSAQSGKLVHDLDLDFQKTERCLIIQFKALNAAPSGVRESTFVTNGDQHKDSCNISGIEAAENLQTLNSSDGKLSEKRDAINDYK